MLTENEYCAKLKRETKILYERRPTVFCPYFNQNIRFTVDGFHHLQYKSSRHERTNKAQIRRYKTFPFAPYVIAQAGTVQQYRKYTGPAGETREDWCFIALVPTNPEKYISIKVIVRKIGSGELNFLSVMPFRAPDYMKDADPD